MENYLCGKIPFGSHLYGTATQNSDEDFKIVYVPKFIDFLTGKKPGIFKNKYYANGQIAGPHAKMDAGCIECEYVPINLLFQFAAQGEVQAIETVFGFLSLRPKNADPEFISLCEQFINQYANSIPCKSMNDFAFKTAEDYVNRSNRRDQLGDAINVIEKLMNEAAMFHSVDQQSRILRPEATLNHAGETVMDKIIEHFKDADPEFIEFVTMERNVRAGTMMRGFRIAGRVFGETTQLISIIECLNTIFKKYGHRVKDVSPDKFEWKSVGHAIRVFRQSLELYETGCIVFPRPDAQELTDIKMQNLPIEYVRNILEQLEGKSEKLRKRGTPVDISQFLTEAVFPYIMKHQSV